MSSTKKANWILLQILEISESDIVLKLSDALLEKYRKLLEKQGIAPRDHDNYKKWLRYYLDFCKKYQHPYLM